jgi:hypothetical protein
MRLRVWFFALVVLECVQASFGLLVRERNLLSGLSEVIIFHVTRQGETRQKNQTCPPSSNYGLDECMGVGSGGPTREEVIFYLQQFDLSPSYTMEPYLKIHWGALWVQ